MKSNKKLRTLDLVSLVINAAGPRRQYPKHPVSLTSQSTSSSNIFESSSISNMTDSEPRDRHVLDCERFRRRSLRFSLNEKEHYTKTKHKTYGTHTYLTTLRFCLSTCFSKHLFRSSQHSLSLSSYDFEKNLKIFVASCEGPANPETENLSAHNYTIMCTKKLETNKETLTCRVNVN